MNREYKSSFGSLWKHVPDYLADPDDAIDSANSNMAAGSGSSSSNSDTSQQVDRIALLYPKVDESETPLPRSWSPKDKFTFIGLSQDNLKVHYKGERAWEFLSFPRARKNPTVLRNLLEAINEF